MSETMKAAVLTRFGGPDAFEIQTLPVPSFGPRQVRVRVHATAINPLDYQIRRGDYADNVHLPAVIGHDISGVVEAVGADVIEFAAAMRFTTRRRSSAAPDRTPRSMSPTSTSSAENRATCRTWRRRASRS